MMRIGLISDTHIPESRKELWPQVFEAFRDVDMIFHGGDIHELYVLDQLNELAPLYSARGNGEDGSAGRPIQPEDERLRYVWQLDFEGVNIGLTHYIPVPERPPNLTVKKWVERLFPDRKPDVIVYGDTHVEFIGVIEGILCVNPGSPTYPHNYNTQLGTIGFLELDNGKADASVWKLTEDGIIPFDWDNPPKLK